MFSEETDTTFCELCGMLLFFSGGGWEICSKCGAIICEDHCNYETENPICDNCKE